MTIGRHLWASWPERMPGFSRLPPPVALIWFIAGVVIGVGIFTPIKREALGGVLGFIAAIFCVFVASFWELWMSV